MSAVPRYPAALSEPSADEWAALKPRAEGDSHIDVVMAVYGGKVETLRALHRVLSTVSRCRFEVVVVNDATPDADLSAKLVSLADRKLITLLTNERNRGYVAAANRGMDLHQDRDIVLLNADTEVFGDWIDRLNTAAAQHNVGTATPWSNAATIMSYPITLCDTQPPLEIADEELDKLAAELDASSVNLPTAVGFCTLIRRACLHATGPFNEAEFGRGYGEENDFCRRALAKGWNHVAAANVFVRHHGGRSFGPGRAALIQSAVAKVEKLHPGYLRAVKEFIRRDPLAHARFLLDTARVRRISCDAELIVGTGKVAASRHAIRLIPETRLFARTWRIVSDCVPMTPNLPAFDPRQSDDELVKLLQALGIKRVNLSTSPNRRLNVRMTRLAASLGAAIAA
jgi:GT2 family glycosyltransferase